MKIKPVYILLFLLILFSGIIFLTRKPSTDWRETYSGRDKAAFGTWILRDQLDRNPRWDLQIANRSAMEMIAPGDHKGANYLFITQSLDWGPTVTEHMMRFVRRGGHIFVAANDFSASFTDSLEFDLNYFKIPDKEDVGSLMEEMEKPALDSAEINFTARRLANKAGFPFDLKTSSRAFSDLDTTSVLVLGRNYENEPNFIRVKYGKGAWFLNLAPMAFTNYSILKVDSAGYASRALSYLPKGELLWDEYYKPYRTHNQSAFSVITEIRALQWAWVILIVLILLWVIFGLRRRQRVIPVVEPPENTSLKFTKTIGRLYFLQGNHKDLAMKKISFFREFIRERLFLSIRDFSPEEADQVSTKSGLPAKEVKLLFTRIRTIKTFASLEEKSLLDLNQKIEAFYQKLK